MMRSIASSVDYSQEAEVISIGKLESFGCIVVEEEENVSDVLKLERTDNVRMPLNMPEWSNFFITCDFQGFHPFSISESFCGFSVRGTTRSDCFGVCVASDHCHDGSKR
jgi:hypothetical protein